MAYSYEEILSDLKKRIFKPVYFLAGEEPYYLDLITSYIEKNILTDNEKQFNQTILYGDDTTIAAIIDTARRFPMMASHQVVIVREAQTLKNLDSLVIYLDKPLASTILVFSYKYKNIDKRTRLFKALQSKAVYFESPRIRDYQIPAWIEKYLSSKGIRTDPTATMMLAEYLGTDLHKIVNELNKLLITLPEEEKPVITTSLIEKNIGISKDYNIFELQKMIGEKNILKANIIVHHFASNPRDNPITLTIASLSGMFSKLLTYHFLSDKSRNNTAAVLRINPYFVRDYEKYANNYNASKTVKIISLLRLFDMKSKGYGDSGNEPGELLKELVFKILHM
jgi:DNA polymerase III subunit delta